MNLFDPLVAPILAAFPEIDAEDLVFNAPPNLEMGDVAIPMFPAAKKLKSAPAKIAAQAAAKVRFGPEVRSAQAAGPYLNLKVDRGLLGKRVADAVLEAGAAFGSSQQGRGLRAVIEHTSINPNASPHVGRARNAMLGDSITRLFRFEGYEVEVHYYVNDMGRQIGLLVLIADEIADLDFDGVLGAYVSANERAKADEAFAEAGYGLLVKMEEGDTEVLEKFRAVTDLCLRGQLAVLERLGAQYDVFDRESQFVRDPRLEPVLEALRAKEALFTDEHDRMVVDLAKLGYEGEAGRYFVLMRANGSSMYGYRDLAYAIEKAALGADLNLIVLGEDHKLYAQQTAMILEAAGFPAPEPIYYAYILLRDGKMSTRQGKVVLLSDFLDQAEALAAERVREQCADLNADEQRIIAKQVALAAVRFTVLRVGANKNVIFEMEQALSFSGDTGPYIQYCCARINSILRKAEEEAAPEPGDDFPAETDAEWALLAALAKFPEVVAGSIEQRTVALIAVHALDVAHLFTTFYHECPVLKADTAEQRAARLEICRATLQVLKNALGLLGIDAPDRM